MTNNWERIRISFDLVPAAINQLQFLEDIQALPQLQETNFLEKAIYRYEKLWIPLLLGSSASVQANLYPPIDVAWIWHCHLLCPTKYCHDMEKIYGKIPDYESISRDNRIQKQFLTEGVWEQNTNTSYNFLSMDSVNNNEFTQFTSQISYNLLNASARQADFYYNVSTPHFRNERFLKLAHDRYQKFLYLKQQNPDCIVVPCYAIDLMWHSHQLNPKYYKIDTVAILGKVFAHDDSINDRTLGGTLDVSARQTRDLWKRTFNEEFFLPGAMYRGAKPSARDYSANFHINYDFIEKWLFSYELLSANLAGKNARETDASFKICVLDEFLNNNSIRRGLRHIRNGQELINVDKKMKLIEEFPKTFSSRILVVYNEQKTMAKFKNIMKHLSRRDPSFDFYYSFDFKLPASICETNSVQDYEITLNSPRQDQFSMKLKWSIQTKANYAEFDVAKKEFQQVDMNDIKHEYRCFDLHEADFKGHERAGDAMKAQHLILNKDEPCFIAEVLHIIPRRWSGIRILKYGELMASSHFIGISQLPIDKQIGISSKDGISLEKFEKAMLVRNLKGDFAIVKGKWVGLKARKGRSPGDPGKLQVTYYSCAKRAMVSFQIPRSFVYKIDCGQIQAEVNLKKGTFDFRFNSNEESIDPLEIESTLAVLFSISTLHAVLQPKPRQQIPEGLPKRGHSATLHRQMVGSRAYSNPYDNFLLLNLIGLTFLMNSPCYHHHIHMNVGGYDGDNDDMAENQSDSWFINETEITNSNDVGSTFDFDDINLDAGTIENANDVSGFDGYVDSANYADGSGFMADGYGADFGGDGGGNDGGACGGGGGACGGGGGACGGGGGACGGGGGCGGGGCGGCGG